MNSSQLFLPLCNGKQQHSAPMGDITQYVNPKIHGDRLAVGGFAKPAEDKRKENNYKTVMCRSWLQSGRCSYREKCRFAHGEHELREPARGLSRKHKTKICEKYVVEGLCPYGVRCDYIHPTAGNTAFYQHHQQEYMPPQHPAGYSQMMYALPGMYGTLGGPPCYPLSRLHCSSSTRRANDLASFYGHLPTFSEEDNPQFSGMAYGRGLSTGGMSRLNALSDMPWNDGGQAPMSMMRDQLGNINGPSKPRVALLPLISRNEAGSCSAARSYLTKSNNNGSILTAEPWNDGGQATMLKKCDLFGNVNDASKPRAPLLPLASCKKVVSCSAAQSRPDNNTSVCAMATAPRCASTPVPKSFSSSLGSDIWSPEKRMTFDMSPERLSIQEVGEKPLHASPDALGRDSGFMENFDKWIAGLDNTSKAHGRCGAFNSVEQNAEKKHSSDGTAPSEGASDELFLDQLASTDFSWLWKH